MFKNHLRPSTPTHLGPSHVWKRLYVSRAVAECTFFQLGEFFPTFSGTVNMVLFTGLPVFCSKIDEISEMLGCRTRVVYTWKLAQRFFNGHRVSWQNFSLNLEWKNVSCNDFGHYYTISRIFYSFWSFRRVTRQLHAVLCALCHKKHKRIDDGVLPQVF